MDFETVIDEKLGVYTYNGIPLLRVTDVLVKSGRIDPSFFTEEGSVRGTAVHDAIFLHISDDLHVASLHPVIRPFVECYLRFEEIIDFKPLLPYCEKRQVHPFYFYTGRPDLLGWLNNRLALIDIKTGSAGAARYQTAAYSKFPALMDLAPWIDRYDLQLNNKGKLPKLNAHKDPNDWLVFLNDLSQVRANFL